MDTFEAAGNLSDFGKSGIGSASGGQVLEEGISLRRHGIASFLY
ncbi:MAG: hypothetical protein ACLR23_02505 [Clostridia bacterium]